MSKSMDFSGISFKSARKKDPERQRVHCAGRPPFLRGPYGSMYSIRPWTIRQYAGYSTAENPMPFTRNNLAAGQKACP